MPVLFPGGEVMPSIVLLIQARTLEPVVNSHKIFTILHFPFGRVIAYI